MKKEKKDQEAREFSKYSALFRKAAMKEQEHHDNSNQMRKKKEQKTKRD